MTKSVSIKKEQSRVARLWNFVTALNLIWTLAILGIIMIPTPLLPVGTFIVVTCTLVAIVRVLLNVKASRGLLTGLGLKR